jgi:hypothetical protein
VAAGGGGVSCPALVTAAGAGVVSLSETVRVALNTAAATEANSIRSGKVIDDLSISALPARVSKASAPSGAKASLTQASWRWFRLFVTWIAQMVQPRLHLGIGNAINLNARKRKAGQ